MKIQLTASTSLILYGLLDATPTTTIGQARKLRDFQMAIEEAHDVELYENMRKAFIKEYNAITAKQRASITENAVGDIGPELSESEEDMLNTPFSRLQKGFYKKIDSDIVCEPIAITTAAVKEVHKIFDAMQLDAIGRAAVLEFAFADGIEELVEGK